MCLFRSLAQLLIGLVVFLLLNFKNFCIFGFKSFFRCMFWKHFLPIFRLLCLCLSSIFHRAGVVLKKCVSFPSFYFLSVSLNTLCVGTWSLVRTVYLLQTAYSWILYCLPSFTGLLNLFTFNVASDVAGFLYAVLLFVFYTSLKTNPDGRSWEADWPFKDVKTLVPDTFCYKAKGTLQMWL